MCLLTDANLAVVQAPPHHRNTTHRGLPICDGIAKSLQILHRLGQRFRARDCAVKNCWKSNSGTTNTLGIWSQSLATYTYYRQTHKYIHTYICSYYAIVYWDNAIIIRLREQVKCQREGNQKIGKKSLRGANPLMHPNDNGAAVWQCQDLMDGSPCTSIVAGREHWLLGQMVALSRLLSECIFITHTIWGAPTYVPGHTNASALTYFRMCNHNGNTNHSHYVYNLPRCTYGIIYAP